MYLWFLLRNTFRRWSIMRWRWWWHMLFIMKILFLISNLNGSFLFSYKKIEKLITIQDWNRTLLNKVFLVSRLFIYCLTSFSHFGTISKTFSFQKQLLLFFFFFKFFAFFFVFFLCFFVFYIFFFFFFFFSKFVLCMKFLFQTLVLFIFV